MNPISQTALAARKSAHWLGLRLADRSIREEAFFLSNRDDLEPSLNSGSICSGDAGVMTILNRLAIEFPDDRALFRGAANEILNNLLSSEEIGDNSLFSGTAGLLIALKDALTFYGSQTVKQWYISRAQDYFNELLAEPPHDPSMGYTFDEYDLISGAAGHLRALSLLYEDFHTNREYLACLAIVREALLEASQVQEDGFPNCRIMPGDYYLENAIELPEGYINLGLAHGIPSVLSALAEASIAGAIALEKPSLSHSLNLLMNSSVGASLDWPSGFGLGGFENSLTSTHRVAWCYGTPGVSLSFKLLAECSQDLGLMRFARQSMRHALSQEKRTSGLISPTFCHGEAGVVTSAIAILGRNTNDLDASLIESHVSTLLNFLDPELPLGVQNYETASCGENQAGLLSGSAGVIHALLAYSSPSTLRGNPWSSITFTGR